MTRSFPEKTFEHWCSMHLSYRYRGKLLMWWPSSGADIEAVLNDLSPGKRFWLELKTTERSGSKHVLKIDLQQLDAYSHQPVPEYYVFPTPRWRGILTERSAQPWLGSVQGQQLAYRSKSAEKWFAEWTWVVPGEQLRNALAKEISAQVPIGKGKEFPIAEIIDGTLAWKTTALKSLQPKLWRDFWTHMEQCGSAGWESEVVLPTGQGLAVGRAAVRAGLAQAHGATVDGGTFRRIRTKADSWSSAADGILDGAAHVKTWNTGARFMALLTPEVFS